MKRSAEAIGAAYSLEERFPPSVALATAEDGRLRSGLSTLRKHQIHKDMI